VKKKPPRQRRFEKLSHNRGLVVNFERVLKRPSGKLASTLFVWLLLFLFPLLMTSVKYSQRSLTATLVWLQQLLQLQGANSSCSFKKGQPRHPSNQFQSVNYANVMSRAVPIRFYCDCAPSYLAYFPSRLSRLTKTFSTFILTDYS